MYKFSMTLSALARLAAIASTMPFVQSNGKSTELKAIREKWKKILDWSIGGEQAVVQLNATNNPKPESLPPRSMTR